MEHVSPFWVEEKVVHFPKGFESHRLYSVLLNSVEKRLLIFGRKNRKFFDKEHWKEISALVDKREDGFDFRLLFLSPNSPDQILYQSHKDDNFKEQLIASINNASNFLEKLDIKFNEVARTYKTLRTTAIIIADDVISYAYVNFDNEGRAKPLTHSRFRVTSVKSKFGQDMLKMFEEAWENGESPII